MAISKFESAQKMNDVLKETNDLENDLNKVTDQVNSERAVKGKKPVNVEARGYSGRG